MTGTFTIIEKPDTISWEDLAKCQQQAHKSNIDSGVQMKCASYSAEELKRKASNGITLVALDDKGNLAGMLTIIVKVINRCWYKGKAAEICYVAVSPDYQGQGVYHLLGGVAIDYLKKKGVRMSYLTTHVDNQHAQRAYEKDGYRKVLFKPGSGLDYYSIVMAKWLDGRGKSRTFCNLMYTATEIAVRILYKPGGKRRFLMCL
jgi:ribosomal protein S18 acetylase RimI-like enzyme